MKKIHQTVHEQRNVRVFLCFTNVWTSRNIQQSQTHSLKCFSFIQTFGQKWWSAAWRDMKPQSASWVYNMNKVGEHFTVNNSKQVRTLQTHSQARELRGSNTWSSQKFTSKSKRSHFMFHVQHNHIHLQRQQQDLVQWSLSRPRLAQWGL